MDAYEPDGDGDRYLPTEPVALDGLPSGLGCVASLLLGLGVLIIVLCAIPAVLAGLWASSLAAGGIQDSGITCHSAECVADAGRLALDALLLVGGQATAIVLVLIGGRLATFVGVGGAIAIAAGATWLALRSEGMLATYFLAIALGTALLAAGAIARRQLKAA